MPSAPALPRPRTLKGALPLLRRPPVPQAVRFKPLNDLGDRCRLVAYTDVRFVIELLNLVCGGRWHAAYTLVPEQLCGTPQRPEDPPMLYVACALTVFDVTREDVGEGRDGTTYGAGPKAARSDALKRAAVHFGVNQALYAMRTVWLDVHAGGSGSCPATHVARTQNGHLFVPDATTVRLRELYARWLSEGSGRTFGAPIDLGEDSGADGVDPEPVGEHELDADRRTTAGTPAYGTPRPPRVGAAQAEPRRARVVALPGTPEQREAIRHGALQVGIDEEQLGVLAELLAGERLLDRLDSAALERVRDALAVVYEAGSAPSAFAVALAKAAAKPDRHAAEQALTSWIAAQAERAGGRQDAA